MSISEVAIRRPVFAWMLMFGLIVFGGLSFFRMGISQMPDVNFPIVNIALQLENSAPEMMELNIVDIIEDAVMGIDGLKSVSSRISLGTANITCEFNMNRNIDVAIQEVQNRILQINNQLPSNMHPPVISKINPEDQPIIWLMLTADKGLPQVNQMMYARNTLKDQFSTIDGVGSVTLSGYVDPNLRVWLDSKKLYPLELTSPDIWNAIQNEQAEQPAGRIEAPLKEFNVRVLGETKTPEDFSKIRIESRGGAINYRPTSLSQVAKVEEGLSDIRAISRYNGVSAIGFGIVKQHGANAVAVAKAVRKKMEQIRPSLPLGYHLDVQLDSSQFIQESVDELNFTLLVSALLTSIVCFFFLGSWSATFNVLLSIPTSVIGTFIALHFLGFTLNSFTLLGLSLAIGIVVDDAIMMLENIVRHFELGKSRRQAAIDGSNEISFAAFATTLAIAAIFLPVIFMKGVVGSFFFQYGITVTVAVFLSLLEALTLTPMRCARFMQSAKNSSNWLMKNVDHLMENIASKYRMSLAWTLRYRWSVVGISSLIFLVSLVFVSTLRKELIPPQDQSLFVLNIRTPVGSSIQATDEVFKKAESYLLAQAEVKDIYTSVGNYEQNNVVNAGSIYIILKKLKERKYSQRQMMDRTKLDLVKLLPADTEVFGQDLSLTGFSASRGYPIEFVIEGPDWEKLKSLSAIIIAKLKQSEWIEDVNQDFQSAMPEVQITPNRTKAAERGVSMSSIAQEVQYMIGGQIFSANTEFPKDDHRYYIRLRSLPEQHSSVESIGNLKIRNNHSEMVTLREIADIKVVESPQLISRYNRLRAMPVFANVKLGQSQQEALNQVERLGKESLPAGYNLKIMGSGNAYHEVFDGLIFALILGIVVAYMVLASQFNSFIHPVTILMALPFSVSGALVALYFTNQSLSLFSMIGLILLMGIVKKNSILLVDFTNQQRTAGLSVLDALLKACPIRLRPILMTSIATIAGAIPGALNFGAGAETRIPMAIAIIGGVTLSTLLTLYVVPCVYSLLSNLERPDGLINA